MSAPLKLKRPLDVESEKPCNSQQEVGEQSALKRKKEETWNEFQTQLEASMLDKCLCKHALGDLVIHLGNLVFHCFYYRALALTQFIFLYE